MISYERLKERLRYDAETGVFYWIDSLKHNIPPGSIAGRRHVCGYWQIHVDGKQYYAHRLAWLIHTGRWPEDKIDHINLDKSDNRICNLRECSKSQNQYNHAIQSRSTSGVKGVCWHSRDKKWAAHSCYMAKRYHLGYFDDLEDAKNAVMEFRKKYHGEFANNG